MYADRYMSTRKMNAICVAMLTFATACAAVNVLHGGKDTSIIKQLTVTIRAFRRANSTLSKTKAA